MRALSTYLWQSLALYLRIVGRDFDGVRISPWTAFLVVRIVYPWEERPLPSDEGDTWQAPECTVEWRRGERDNG
jgi:hypothetical protein